MIVHRKLLRVKNKCYLVSFANANKSMRALGHSMCDMGKQGTFPLSFHDFVKSVS